MPSLKLLPLFVILAALAAGCSKKTEPETPSSGSSTDRDKLQGLWALESIDEGRPDESQRAKDELKNSRVKVEGDKFTIFADGDEMKFTFKVDESKNPKVLTLTEVLEDGRSRRGTPTYRGTKKTEPEPVREPEKWDWIYKFEGEKIVVAFMKGGERDRPTEFKAKRSNFDGNKPEPGVTVIVLVKTDSPPPPPEPRKYPTFRGTKK